MAELEYLMYNSILWHTEMLAIKNDQDVFAK